VHRPQGRRRLPRPRGPASPLGAVGERVGRSTPTSDSRAFAIGRRMHVVG
jgi:hypothetical protein